MSEDNQGVGYFKPTQEELDDAAKGGTREILKFEKGEKVAFTFTGVKESINKDGEPMFILGANVMTGANKGKEFAFFFGGENKIKKAIFINMLKSFMEEAEMLDAGISYSLLIGKTLESKAVVGDKYTNFYQWEEYSNAPDLEAEAINRDSIPF